MRKILSNLWLSWFPWSRSKETSGNLGKVNLRKLLPAAGAIWALRAQSCKESRKMSSRALLAPGPKKSKTESKKSQNQLFFNYFDSFSNPFWTFWALGPTGPGNSLSNSVCNFDPKGPNDPCSRQKFSQKLMGFFKRVF